MINDATYLQTRAICSKIETDSRCTIPCFGGVTCQAYHCASQNSRCLITVGPIAVTMHRVRHGTRCTGCRSDDAASVASFKGKASVQSGGACAASSNRLSAIISIKNHAIETAPRVQAAYLKLPRVNCRLIDDIWRWLAGAEVDQKCPRLERNRARGRRVAIATYRAKASRHGSPRTYVRSNVHSSHRGTGYRVQGRTKRVQVTR